MPVEQTMTRTERRRLATHEDLLAATADVLLEHGLPSLNARVIAREADHAVATFYNHFADVDAAIDELIQPTADWAADWARRIIGADDFETSVAEWIADYLVRLQADGREWQVLRAANREPVSSEQLATIASEMVQRHADEFDSRGVPPGQAGAVALHIMVSSGDLYGSRTLPAATQLRLAAVLHAVHWSDPEAVRRGAQRSVEFAQAAAAVSP